MIRKNKDFLITFAITLVLFWGLYVLGYNYEVAHAVSAVVLFPFGPFWMIYEHYCLSLNDPSCSLPINDEITGGLLFLLTVISQTFVYYNVYKKSVGLFKDFRVKKL